MILGRRIFGSLALIVVLAAAGCHNVAPPVVTAPRFPDFVTPTLSPPDPRLAALEKTHAAAWQFLQAGDLTRAEREFQAILKRSAAFYPSEAALGYVSLARQSYEPALQHFDRVLQAWPTYVPALVGRGETLLALSREPEALAAFEAALQADSTLTDISRRVEVLKARAAQEKVAAAGRAAAAGRLEEAAADYQEAIAASPESAFLF